jgi:hypothetical protein
LHVPLVALHVKGDRINPAGMQIVEIGRKVVFGIDVIVDPARRIIGGRGQGVFLHRYKVYHLQVIEHIDNIFPDIDYRVFGG